MLNILKKPFLPLLTRLGKEVEKRQFSEEPILVGGCGRSGTTLLLSLLSAHPHVFACPKELGLFNHSKVNAEGEVKPKRIDRLYRTLLFNSIPKTAERWCEKSPSNVHHISEIDAYFNGNFKFIHLIRDGRDVVLSVHPTAPDRYWVEPERWVRDVKAGLAYRHHPNVLTIKYENLITDFENTLQTICKFANLPLTDEVLHWHRHAKVRKNSAYFSSVEALHDKSVEKWKEPKAQSRIQKFMNDHEAVRLLEKLGYPVSTSDQIKSSST